ncbi:shikimate kinase [Leeuwenhoekiella nanhaiensis]|uniref:Shikimate kinase n=1 Tax=Leeuwenhoekiella nanhaiensis TaxID=1655491 RepID=A0A2G1VRT5_9FLAO|nr:shikimate kinase [Leeuwenhoekiella nanhaiensis]PHQ29320.1 shikimate kinase [Leeuwenhoekiella nanhaiensis]
MKIYLIGYMGSGKSTLGRALAQKQQLRFIDFDEYLEEKEGQSIATIFKEKGEIYFRKRESHYLDELLDLEEEAVISLGGGTPCYGDAMQRIKAAPGTSVYINVPVTELSSRLWSQREHRPVLNHQDTPEKLEEFVRKHLFERSFYYNQADLILRTQDQTPEDSLKALEAALF